MTKHKQLHHAPYLAVVSIIAVVAIVILLLTFLKPTELSEAELETALEELSDEELLELADEQSALAGEASGIRYSISGKSVSRVRLWRTATQVYSSRARPLPFLNADEYISGDLNRDGYVELEDLMPILNMWQKLETDPALFIASFAADYPKTCWDSLDVNGDGVIAPTDALLLITELNKQQRFLKPTKCSATPPVIVVTRKEAQPQVLLEVNTFIRGDANSDGKVDITDAVFILNFLFSGGEAPSCTDAADVNGDNQVDISDGVALLNYLFGGGQAPPPPTYPNTAICDIQLTGLLS